MGYFNCVSTSKKVCLVLTIFVLMHPVAILASGSLEYSEEFCEALTACRVSYSCSNYRRNLRDCTGHEASAIIRNNKDVKGCYGQVRAETGTFPKSVDVMFTLQPTGKVSSAYIASGPYVGSKFEGCMRAAFKGMTFPTFDQGASPQTLKYNLKL